MQLKFLPETTYVRSSELGSVARAISSSCSDPLERSSRKKGRNLFFLFFPPAGGSVCLSSSFLLQFPLFFSGVSLTTGPASSRMYNFLSRYGHDLEEICLLNWSKVEYTVDMKPFSGISGSFPHNLRNDKRVPYRIKTKKIPIQKYLGKPKKNVRDISVSCWYFFASIPMCVFTRKPNWKKYSLCFS